MYVRQRLDVGVRDLLWALAAACLPRRRGPLEERLEGRFETPDAAAVSCLSVRTGLDLCLEAVAFPAGSEVLVSALTIPDMARVLERHGLVPVPVDVDLATLAPELGEARALATPRTRAVLIAHLFGTRVRLDPWVELAREHGWLLLEDCAQSFDGLEGASDPRSDLAFFSFGPIKTATALGGAVVRLRDRALAGRVRALRDADPVASGAAFARRAAKYLGLLILTRPVLYALFARRLERKGRSLDEVVTGLARGFPAAELFARLRHRMCAAQLALLDRRIARFDPRGVAARRAAGCELAGFLGGAVERPGAAVESHFWVFPVLSADRAATQQVLYDAGYDSTCQATLSALEGRDGAPPEALRFKRHALYVPAYAALGVEGRERLAAAIVDQGASDSATRGSRRKTSSSSTPSTLSQE